MRNAFKKIAAALLLLFSPALLFAQNNTGMADTMRSNGRIYVVVAVMTTILLGLIFYVSRLDRKISKLEKETK
ncbi:MAG: CcmD family protein [Chitinophagaceae bacterium]|nr:CcmD family protein [Chitinophagaceae bacterium]